jgi:enoyl-CoA hydratase
VAFLLVSKPKPHVTLVTLNRPERMNAMSFDVMIRSGRRWRRSA